ncbi:MAG: RNA methyltransferase [Bacteroidetes bacterium]|nr:RNA methyltransferase [Bacteroidota bacterium]
MLSNALLKQFASLKAKKFRQKYSQFAVEGKKSIKELTNTKFIPDTFLFRKQKDIELTRLFPQTIIIENCSDKIDKISSFEHPGDVIAIIPIQHSPLQIEDIKYGVSLFLDEIQDPGNLGTIIRLAVWFGINHICFSKGCADIFNPKTIQASMGGFAKIKFIYTDKEQWVRQARVQNIAIIGTFLDGKNIHQFDFPQTCIIVIGNEGSGISSEVERYISQKITIPGSGNIESLNAAMATAIVLDNMYRQQH